MGLIALIAFCGILVYFAKRKWDKDSEAESKAQKPADDVEKYIPQSVMQASFKCSKCGASVPLSSDKNLVTMFCPFCGSPIDDASKVMEQARANKKQEYDYQMRMREFDSKDKINEIELQRIKSENRAKITRAIFENFRYIVAALTVIFMLVYFILISNR